MLSGFAALLDADRRWFLIINGIDHALWNVLMGWGTNLGYGAALTVLLLVLCRRYDRTRFPKNFALVGLAMAMAGLVNSTIKDAVHRPRPINDPVLQVVDRPFIRDTQYLPVTRDYPIEGARIDGRVPALKVMGPVLRRQSFPSGHTAAAFALATGLIYVGRRGRRWWWLLFASAIGVSRVACGVHFPLDVIGGAFVGSAVSLVFLRLFEPFHGLASPPLPVAPRRSREAPLKVMMVAGEASADVYGERIIAELRRFVPRVDVFGVGGERLERSGMRLLAGAHDLSIVGFTAVLVSIVTIVRIYLRLLFAMRREQPEVLVCIDLPDFNLMLATQARAAGIPVVFVISPQFWAWRQGRIPKIAERISRMIVAFPFEKPFYEAAKVSVGYHGHPLLEILNRRFPDAETAKAHFGLDPAKKTLVIAPGSRRNEYRYLLDEMIEAARIVQRTLPGWQIAVPLAPKADEEAVRAAADRHGVEVVCTRGDNFDLFSCADFGIICSGTATLEAALAGLPMVIAYRGNPLNIVLARRLVKIDRIGLPNIILGGSSVTFPELIQEEAGAQGQANRTLRILRAPDEYERLRAACGRVRTQLDGGAVSAAIAQDILSLLVGDDAEKTLA